MKILDKVTEASKLYADAYSAHYQSKNLHKAIVIYNDIVTAYPDSLEAGFAAAQIKNIVSAVVPNQKLLEVQFDLAIRYFDSTYSNLNK